MKGHLKRIGFIVAIVSLLFLAACGGGDNKGNNETPTTVAAGSFTASALDVTLEGDNQTATFTLTGVAPSTAVVTAEAPASSGITCDVSGTGTSRTITCTISASTAANSAPGYTITATATANGKSDKTEATLKVNPVEIVLVEDEETVATLASDESSTKVKFSATAPWTATATDGWISLSLDGTTFSGSLNGDAGDIAIQVKLDENRTGTNRPTTITIATENTHKQAIITQGDVKTNGNAELDVAGIILVHVEKTGDGGEDDQGFLMGCTRNEGGYTSTNCQTNARYAHTVQLTQDYYIGKYEVTLKQWKQVAHSVPENAVTEFDGSPNDNLPVTWVSYQDVGKYIDGLNNIGEYATTDYAIPGMKWALPTEAQWEYAARGGNKPTNCPQSPNAEKWGCLYSGSRWYDNVAWHQANSNGTIHPVGTVVPTIEDNSSEPPRIPADSSNELGVFDMSGNVSEWVYDWLTPHTTEPRKDYGGPETGNSHVFRGGSFEQVYVYTTVAWRGPTNDLGDDAYPNKGFRLALVPDPDYIPDAVATSTPAAKPTFFESASGTVSGLWDSAISGVKSLWNSITK